MSLWDFVSIKKQVKNNLQRVRIKTNFKKYICIDESKYSKIP